VHDLFRDDFGIGGMAFSWFERGVYV